LPFVNLRCEQGPKEHRHALPCKPPDPNAQSQFSRMPRSDVAEDACRAMILRSGDRQPRHGARMPPALREFPMPIGDGLLGRFIVMPSRSAFSYAAIQSNALQWDARYLGSGRAGLWARLLSWRQIRGHAIHCVCVLEEGHRRSEHNL